MKIACASDIHSELKITWPRADVLVLAGDICPDQSRIRASNAFIQCMWLEATLNPFLTKLIETETYTDIVIIPGNHDLCFDMEKDRAREALQDIPNVHLLIDEGVKIQNRLFWGSPWTPYFYGEYFSFNFPDHYKNPARARAHARAAWELIPSETDVLITHGPPFTILDAVHDGREVGCPYLAEEVFKRIRPQAHIFGHIHPGHGHLIKDGIQFVNAAICKDVIKDGRIVAIDASNPVRIIEI